MSQQCFCSSYKSRPNLLNVNNSKLDIVHFIKRPKLVCALLAGDRTPRVCLGRRGVWRNIATYVKKGHRSEKKKHHSLFFLKNFWMPGCDLAGRFFSPLTPSGCASPPPLASLLAAGNEALLSHSAPQTSLEQATMIQKFEKQMKVNTASSPSPTPIRPRLLASC